MKKSEFFSIIEEYKWLVKGNGREIADRAGISYEQYLNARRAGESYDDMRRDIADAIKELHQELPALEQNETAA